MKEKAKYAGCKEFLDELVAEHIDYYIYGTKMQTSDLIFTMNEKDIKKEARKEYCGMDW